MLKPYRTIQDVLASPWTQQPQADRVEQTDRVLRSTKLENNIYHDLRAEDTAMDEIERGKAEILSRAVAGRIPVVLFPDAPAQ